MFGHISDKVLTKDNWELKLTDENKILVTDLINEVNEELDFKDRFPIYQYKYMIELFQCQWLSTI